MFDEHLVIGCLGKDRFEVIENTELKKDKLQT